MSAWSTSTMELSVSSLKTQHTQVRESEIAKRYIEWGHMQRHAASIQRNAQSLEVLETRDFGRNRRQHGVLEMELCQPSREVRHELRDAGGQVDVLESQHCELGVPSDEVVGDLDTGDGAARGFGEAAATPNDTGRLRRE